MPMSAGSLRERLQALRPQVLAISQRYGAANLRVYGSVLTGRDHVNSDLDLLVDLPPEQSLLSMIALRQELEDLLGCSVDLTEVDSLHPCIRRSVLDQAEAL